MNSFLLWIALPPEGDRQDEFYSSLSVRALHFWLHWAWKLNLILLCYCLSPAGRKMHQNHNLWLEKADSGRGEIAARRYSCTCSFPGCTRWMVYDYRLKWQMSAHSGEHGEKQCRTSRRQHRGQLIMQRQRTTFRHFGWRDQVMTGFGARGIESWFAF